MFSIRKANQSDFLDIANIHFTSWNAAYSKLLPTSYISQENSLPAKVKMWQEIIAHPNVTVWIAHDSNDEKNQHSVGFIGYFNKSNDYEITTLYVLPDYHHLGIGSELMTVALMDILDFNASPDLCLWVLEANVSAISFYKKHGFVTNGESSEELYESCKIVDVKMVKSA